VATIKIRALGLGNRARIAALYDHIDQTCLVMIDRSMWFAKSYEALSLDEFAPLVHKHPRLTGKQREFREPVILAFSYAQRVFLCSAVELCLLHQHANSVLLLAQMWPTEIRQLSHLIEQLKKKRKVRTWDEWDGFSWDAKLEMLRELSFSRLQSAVELFGDIYGADCFDLAWGRDGHEQIQRLYEDYQDLRNGIVHRGGELSSGAKIEATEGDIVTAFQDAKRFRDALQGLSRWCRSWWLKRLASSHPKAD
jgi:hypothetical protein